MSILSSLTTKIQFRNYIYKKLGSEFNCIEVSTDQLDLIIDETVQMYSEYAQDGLLPRIFSLDVLANTQDYVIDDTGEPNIYCVENIMLESRIHALSLNQTLGDDTMILNAFRSQGYWYRFFDYEIMGSYLEMYNKIYKRKISYHWDESSQTIHFYDPFESGDTLALFVQQYRANAYELYSKKWVREYAVAQSRMQWGRNLGKFGNVTLPGGATINSDEIKADAKDEIEKLETRLIEDIGVGSDFFVG